MKKIILLFYILYFSVNFAQQQNHFQYKEVPSNFKEKYKFSRTDFNRIKKQKFSKAKSIIPYLPKSYDTTGKIDYTKYVQKAFNENSVLILPNFPILINVEGIAVKSNSKILFQEKSLLIMKTNDKEFYTALNIEGVENVEIYFGNVRGDRKQHTGTTGEWGMGYFIRHSKNILLYKPKAVDFWGDGIYLGKVDGLPSKNITIDGAFLDNNRRNGISIISGDNVIIKNSFIANTNGTIPEYGIDVEPNKPDDVINQLVLDSNITYNNNKGGVLFALDNMQSSTGDVIGASLLNHTSYDYDKGLEFYIDRGYTKFQRPIKGNITIENLSIVNAKNPIISNDSANNEVNVKFKNIKIQDGIITNSKLLEMSSKIQEGKLQILAE